MMFFLQAYRDNEQLIAESVRKIDPNAPRPRPAYARARPPDPTSEDMLEIPPLASDVIGHGIITAIMSENGYLSSKEHGEMFFKKQSVLRKRLIYDPENLYTMNQVLEIGQSVYYNANRANGEHGPNVAYNAVRVVPLGRIEEALGFVYKLDRGHGFINAPEKGYIFFPFSAVVNKQFDRAPPMHQWGGMAVQCRITPEVPGYASKWRATCVQLVEGQDDELPLSGAWQDAARLMDTERRRPASLRWE